MALDSHTGVFGEASRGLVSGVACCNEYKYYAFPAVPEREAPSVDFNLTSGMIKVYLL